MLQLLQKMPKRNAVFAKVGLQHMIDEWQKFTPT